MKREDIKAIFAEATPEQLEAAMTLYGKETEKAQRVQNDLKDAKSELDEARKKVSEYETEIGSLRDSVGEAEKMKKKLEELQKTIDERKAADEAAVREKAVADRFDAACGETKFLNDFTRSGLLSEFREALEDKANEGKSDKDIFSGLIQGRDNLFLPEGGVPGVVSHSGGDTANAGNDIREIMGLPPLKN